MNMTPGLAFDPESHVYRLHGKVVPSVTTILKDEGHIDTRWFTDEARDRGTAVHAAIHYLTEGDLDWSTVDPRIEPYLRAFDAFMREAGWTSFAAEVKLASINWWYSGTLDQLGWFRGLDRLGVVDFKSGAFAPWQELQVAAYRELVIQNREELGLRLKDIGDAMSIVQLRRDGTYIIHPVENTQGAARAWRSARDNHFFRTLGRYPSYE